MGHSYHTCGLESGASPWCNEHDPIECSCDDPLPDPIDECQRCYRVVLTPERVRYLRERAGRSGSVGTRTGPPGLAAGRGPRNLHLRQMEVR